MSTRIVTTPVLQRLRASGVLGAAEVHVADAVARRTGERDPDVLLAVALAVGAPAQGHVCLELARVLTDGLAVEGEAPVEVELPPLDRWLAALRASPAVRDAADAADAAAAVPLVLDRDRLYLDRYWRYEQRLLARLRALAVRCPDDRDPTQVEQVLDGLFPGVGPDDPQRRAASVASRRALTVLTGGPGTGKTTTVVRLLAALVATAPPGARPRIALAAPTGKAAARLAETVRDAAGTLPVGQEVIEALLAAEATTLHRLLGWRPDAPTRFRHDASDRLPEDVVVVDEASMASLPLVAKLVDALADQARLVLVGDRDQLTSIDAGAVLDDLCGPRDRGRIDRADPSVRGLDDSIVALTRFHRFGPDSGIGAVAGAIRRADADGTIELLRGVHPGDEAALSFDDVVLLPPDPGRPGGLPAGVWSDVIGAYRAAVDAAGSDADPVQVLAAYGRLRVLTALRRGPDGVDALNRSIAAELGLPLRAPGGGPPLGLPLMVTRNDQHVGLYNGDVGVVVRDPQQPERHRVAFPTEGGGVRLVVPARVPDPEPVFAMSVHKSQGSQFDEVVLVLPTVPSPLLSRELVYTGITRARHRVTVVATEERLREALARAVQRASGLAERLWGTTAPR